MAETLPGRFIVLDGPEGCGKTTQAAHLVRRLREKGRQATAVRDPGSTPVSERIRDVLLDKRLPEMDARTEVFLYMASRAEMMTRIVRPALEVGLVVVSDRFISSTVAYQGYAGGIEPDLIWELGRAACGGIEPDLTVILDVDVETSFARLQRDIPLFVSREQREEGARFEADRIESKERAYHEKVRQGFLAMARERPDRFMVVDASRPPDEVAAEIEAAVARVL